MEDMDKPTINLVKVSGACAILYGVTWVAWLVVSAAATPWTLTTWDITYCR